MGGDVGAATPEFVGDLIVQAGDVIADRAGRQFELDATPTLRVFPVLPSSPAALDKTVYSMRIGDLSSAEGLVVSVADYELLPYVRVRPWQPYTRINLLGGVSPGDRLEITGVWGFPEVPARIRLAAIMTVSEWIGGTTASQFSETFATAEANAGGVRQAFVPGAGAELPDQAAGIVDAFYNEF